MRWQLLKAFIFSPMPGVKLRPETFLGMKHASEHVRILFHEDFLVARGQKQRIWKKITSALQHSLSSHLPPSQSGQHSRAQSLGLDCLQSRKDETHPLPLLSSWQLSLYFGHRCSDSVLATILETCGPKRPTELQWPGGNDVYTCGEKNLKGSHQRCTVPRLSSFSGHTSCTHRIAEISASAVPVRMLLFL